MYDHNFYFLMVFLLENVTKKLTLHLIYWLGSEYASELIRSMFQVFRPFKMELQPGNSLFEQKKIFKGKSLPRLAFSRTTLDCNPYATLFFFCFPDPPMLIVEEKQCHCPSSSQEPLVEFFCIKSGHHLN